MAGIVLENDDAVKRQLEALGPEARAAANAAVLQGAKIIASAARPRVPRSKRPRTGGWRTGRHVADVLKAEAVQGTRYATAGVTTPGGVANGSYFYIRFLEYGAKGRNRAGHYIGNAAKANEAQVESVIASEVKRRLGL